MRVLSWSWLLLSLGMLLGCFPKGDPSKPIPTTLLAAPQKAQRLVVVLPGRGDSVDGLARSGIADAVQSAWPDADVILTGLALGYYMQGQAERRLHDEVIVPARKRGYAEVWLVGASMGGMGALMYDRAHPTRWTASCCWRHIWARNRCCRTSRRRAALRHGNQAPPRPPSKPIISSTSYGVICKPGRAIRNAQRMCGWHTATLTACVMRCRC